MKLILHSALGILTTLILISVWIFFAYAGARKRAIHATRFISKPLCMTPQLNTGDIVLIQYASSGLHKYSGLEFVPLHCGMVWLRNNEPFVIEATRFQHPALTDFAWGKSQGSGVRLVKFVDLLNSVDGCIAVRPLIKGTIDDWMLEQEMHHWAVNLTFNPLVSMRMSFLELVTIGFGPAYPNFGRVTAYLSGLSLKKNPHEVFCSEFLVMLLQKLGHIDKNFTDHWSIAPISLTLEANKIDLLSLNSQSPLIWDKEFPFL